MIPEKESVIGGIPDTPPATESDPAAKISAEEVADLPDPDGTYAGPERRVVGYLVAEVLGEDEAAIRRETRFRR